MENTVKLIALDMDGTLLSGNGNVSTEGISLLKQFRDQGILIVICTGRPYYSIQRIFQEPVYDYVIGMNGQTITDAKTGITKELSPLNKEEIAELKSYLYRYPMVLSYSDNDKFYHTAAPLYRVLLDMYHIVYAVYHKITRKPYYPHKMKPLREVQITSCGKFCFASFGFVLNHFAKHLNTSRYALFFVNRKWLEVLHSGISKGNALKLIMAEHQIDASQACAIGDGENDLSMFDAVGTKVAMANAMPRVKEKANAFALSNKEDGAVRWLKDNISSKASH